MPKDPQRLDRHSGTGNRGEPKKDGHGGWGKAGDQAACPAAVDSKDPNYNSDDEKEEKK
eukprot:CAMPEP_0114612374 /NCGR_PEP_ID=MMETSP0168-20121206/4589_1 /TAXON_ID=95228 ORGANISM="Vannella sp., Strain DIVA3 517/6/12" /NCGR_SAMPLE_ID=MMETSP0168 /ASSEMBLY_ACC=CAM_ASM_000044 /LENGTH=58 /DNA_ID=CAMNT_0001823357 /DNA_START=83 /DNA_END=259 /DNA_ORIENTATION=-